MSNDDRKNIHMNKDGIVRLKSSSVRDALMDKARTKLNREEYLDAISLLNKVIDMDPKYIESRMLLIEALMQISCYDKVLWEIARAIADFGESNEFIMQLGNYYLETEQYAAAQDAYKLVLLGLNDDADDGIIDTLIEAMDYCESMLYEDDESYIADEGSSEEGADDEYPIRDVSDLEHDDLIERVETLYNDAEYSKVIEILEPYAHRNPWDGMLINVLLMSYYCAREFQRGAKYLKSVSKKTNYSVSMHCVAAMIYKNADMPHEAEEECNAALHQQPDVTDDALKVCAMLCEMGKDNEQVLKYATICYNMRPYDKEIIHLYARSLAIGGDTAAAAKLYSRILCIYPGDLTAKFYRDMCLRGDSIDSDTIPVEYSLQAGDILTKIANFMKARHSDNKLSASERREIQDIVKWALDCGSYSTAATIIALMGPCSEQMRNLCQYIMKHPDLPEKIRMAAINVIGFDEGLAPSLCIRGGRLMMVKVRQKKIPKSQRKGSASRKKTNATPANANRNKNSTASKERDVPLAYALIGDGVKRYLKKHKGEPWKDSAMKLVDEFTTEGVKERTRYTDDQIEAIKAAIIFFAPFVDDADKKLTYDELMEAREERRIAVISEFRLSTVRFNNALQLLIKYSKTAYETAKRLGVWIKPGLV